MIIVILVIILIQKLILNLLINKNFVVSYIKLYGSKYKYNGSHSSDLYKIIKTIKDNDLLKIHFISKINPNKKHFIYFNNLETDFNNIRYKPNELSDDETLTSESDFVQEISSVKDGIYMNSRISRRYIRRTMQKKNNHQQLKKNHQKNKKCSRRI